MLNDEELSVERVYLFIEASSNALTGKIARIFLAITITIVVLDHLDCQVSSFSHPPFPIRFKYSS